LKKTELVISIRNTCNYSCVYCIGHAVKQAVVLQDLEKLEMWLNQIGGFIVSRFECGSGEPTLHPQIADFIKLFTKYGQLIIPSNNSTDPWKYIPEECAKRVRILSAFHSQAEGLETDYIKRLLWVIRKGGMADVSFIAYPPWLQKAAHYKKIFEEAGIIFNAIPFYGEYEGIKYPEGHTKEHRSLMELGNTWYNKLIPDMEIRDFKGIPCLAGHTKLHISEYGNLQRCLYDAIPLSGPLDKATPCSVPCCGCGLYLEELNTQTTEYWNKYLRACGLPLEEVAEKSNDEIYLENLKKYQDLMNKYQKRSQL